MQHDFQADIEKLEAGVLPENWEWIHCSKLAKMAKHTAQPVSYFKEFMPKNRLEFFKAKVRGNRCEKWVKQAQISAEQGFSAPEILATGTLKNNNPYLVTKSGPSTCVPDFLYKNRNKDEVSRQKYIVAFAEYIGKMHKAGIVHGDLRAGNILMTVENGQPEFMMIDIERNSYHKQVPMRLVQKNLVQLIKRICFDTFTAKDRTQFMKHYCKAYDRFTQKEAKQLGYDVIALVKKQNLWGGNENVA